MLNGLINPAITLLSNGGFKPPVLVSVIAEILAWTTRSGTSDVSVASQGCFPGCSGQHSAIGIQPFKVGHLVQAPVAQVEHIADP